jgi:hypothetical protein
MNNKGESMNDKWAKYHETRETVIESIKSHINSIENVNVYHSETNQSDSFSLMNEQMGLDLLRNLINKLKID